mmetsp:Transcript_7686/g.19618  ORF Transcript_7686/g.19618 Transcript_7686/m.19618 type:complete len:227 (-) Transcript_7686:542-1222(-)
MAAGLTLIAVYGSRSSSARSDRTSESSQSKRNLPMLKSAWSGAVDRRRFSWNSCRLRFRPSRRAPCSPSRVLTRSVRESTLASSAAMVLRMACIASAARSDLATGRETRRMLAAGELAAGNGAPLVLLRLLLARFCCAADLPAWLAGNFRLDRTHTALVKVLATAGGLLAGSAVKRTLNRCPSLRRDTFSMRNLTVTFWSALVTNSGSRLRTLKMSAPSSTSLPFS